MTLTTASSCQIIAAASTTLPSSMNTVNMLSLSEEGGAGVYRKRKYTRHQRRSEDQGRSASGVTSNIHSDDNDMFSDDDEGERCSKKSLSGSPSELIDEDRRAHHNELERRRRDHIKDHFMALKNSIPLLEGEKSSRALILKRAVDYISLMQAQLKEYKLEMERQNEMLTLAKQHAKAVYNKPTTVQQQLRSSFSPPQQSAGLTATTFLTGAMHQQSSSPISTSSAIVGSLPFSATTPTILSTSTAINVSTNPLANNPVSNKYLSSALPDTLRLATTTEPMANNTNNLSSFLSSLLIQNHPLLSQLQFQQQQQKQLESVITSTSLLTAFGAIPAGNEANCTTTNKTNMLNSSLLAESQGVNETHLLNSSLVVEAQRARLIASTLALRERQLAAAAATASGNTNSVV